MAVLLQDVKNYSHVLISFTWADSRSGFIRNIPPKQDLCPELEVMFVLLNSNPMCYHPVVYCFCGCFHTVIFHLWLPWKAAVLPLFFSLLPLTDSFRNIANTWFWLEIGTKILIPLSCHLRGQSLEIFLQKLKRRNWLRVVVSPSD